MEEPMVIEQVYIGMTNLQKIDEQGFATMSIFTYPYSIVLRGTKVIWMDIYMTHDNTSDEQDVVKCLW